MGKFGYLLFYFGFAVSLVAVCNTETSEYHLCADKQCQKVISKATVLRDYNPDSKEKLSLKARDNVSVVSKPVDKGKKLWEVIAGNKRGLVPIDVLQEERVLVAKEKLIEVRVTGQKKETTPKDEPPQLKSSIPPDVPEVTTTAPLSIEPKTVDTTHGDVDASTEKPNASPLQNHSEILDGTQLPPGYNDFHDGGEAPVGVDEEENSEAVTEALSIQNESSAIGNDKQTEEAQIESSNATQAVAGSIVPPSTSEENATSAEFPQNSTEADEPKEQLQANQRVEGLELDMGGIVPLSTSEENDTSAEIPQMFESSNSTEADEPPPTQMDSEAIPDQIKHDSSSVQTENVTKLDDVEQNKEINALDVDKNKVDQFDTKPPQPSTITQMFGQRIPIQTHAEPPSTYQPSAVADSTANKENNDTKDTSEQIKANNSPNSKGSELENPAASTPPQAANEKANSQNPEDEQPIGKSAEEIIGEKDTDPQGDKIDLVQSQGADAGNLSLVNENDEQEVRKEVEGTATTEKVAIPSEESLEANPVESAETVTTERSGLNQANKDENRDPGHEEEHSNERSKVSDSQDSAESGKEILAESAETSEHDPSPAIGELSTMSPDEDIFPTPGYDPMHLKKESETTESPEDGEREHEVAPTGNSDGEHPPTSEPNSFEESTVKNNWFFSNVFDVVKNFWPTKDEQRNEEEIIDDGLKRILFPDRGKESSKQDSLPQDGYCEKLTPHACPSEKGIRHNALASSEVETCSAERDFFSSLSDKVLEMVDLLACLLITALTTLIFSFGYYCICHSRKEGVLLSKLNIVERSLLASNKEAAILKHDLIETRNKLASIENNSFGSNDMVIALKRELQDSEDTKLRLQEQVASLEKELENAAEAGLELNKIVSELLNNQSGDDSIISSVEELQKQLNEQQNTIFQINATLAEKSRENSELQLILTNQTAKFQEEILTQKQVNEDLRNEKILLESKLEESKQLLQDELSKLNDEKQLEIKKKGKEMVLIKEKYDEVYRKLQASEARAQVLEECLNGVKNNAKFNIKDLIDAVNLKTEVVAIRRERDSLKERLEGELDARKLLEDHVKIISEEVSNLKREYNQSEKEKVEAQTRLEVLSSYFKDKETQLQKELSLKEAMWLKQQGETSSTVERVRHMQDEIQALKSQNDSLRAEIEAQAATHKTHVANLENRAHETWLAARQSERKLEEARTEATALRRKLTSMAGNSAPNEANSQNRTQNAMVDGLTNDVNNAPSPVHMDSASSPLLGGLPPPLPFLPPPPFMAPPHPFMPMPPPFMPPGEMRPPPLGRLMSPPPPPPPDRYSPSLVEDRDRYSPPNGRYSPDHYNYTTDHMMSNYDTETDFSPPPSPGIRPAGGGGGGTGGNGGGGGYSGRERERDRERDRGRERNTRSYKPFSPPPPLSNSERNKKSKGILSSGSADSYDSRKSKGKGKV